MKLSLDHLQPFLPGQEAGFTYEADTGKIATIAYLGGWGSGKTHGAARTFFNYCLMNGWHEVYGTSTPKALIVAPTYRVLQQATLVEFFNVCPSAFVLRRRGPPHNDILLANGVTILTHSGEAEIEGITASVVWIDEIHRPTFANHATRFPNLMARLRDKKAPQKAMIVSGLPESGWIRERFDIPGVKPEILSNGPDKPPVRVYKNDRQCTVLMPTVGNTHNDPDVVSAYFSQCPSGQEESLLGGNWMPPQGAIYPQFSADIHLTDFRGNADAVTHIGLDIGDHGAMLFAQQAPAQIRNIVGRQHTENGLIVVDQILTHDQSVDAMCYQAKTRTGWNIFGPNTTICTDPTTRRDETKAIRKHFPNARIVKRERGHETFPIESGIRLTQSALRDALGNVRLRFWRGLADESLGVIDGLQRYRRNPVTGLPVKDNSRDHCLDALRYLAAEWLRTEKPEARILSG